ncbi:MAG: acyl-CoA dehydrogenase family protein [Ilumatobacteraceae bacterium]|nr:acyl-CoA dehydrogenase family protein [Ilumatobacteraceae bacterium]
MDLSLTEDQQTITELFASFFAKECDGEFVREAEPLGHHDELWAKLIEMGMVSMGVPADAGGGGLGLLDLALVAEVYGSSIAPVPFVEAVVAARLLAAVGSSGSELLASVVDGSTATIALRPAVDRSARLVPAAAVADIVIALDGDELVAVSQGASNRPTAVKNLGSGPVANVDLTLSARQVLAVGNEAQQLYATALLEWKALTASALVGLGREALRIGLQYVMERHQFGVPIGSFQSVQHRFADDATALDAAGLLARKAAWSVDEGEPDAVALVSQGFIFASEGAQRTAGDSLHFHGGYGFMLEYDIQLYYRRAKAWSIIWDDPRRELARVADALYGPVGAA